MIERFREIENSYIENFSLKEEKENYIVFKDSNLPDMYSFNCIVVKNNIDDLFIKEFLEEQLNGAKSENRDFLKIIFHPNLKLSSTIKESIKNMGFQLQTNLYMKLKNNTNIAEGNIDSIVKIPTCEKELEEGEALDIETSIRAGMPPEFSKRKALRKKQIFKDESKNLYSYLCYLNNKAIGKCELHIQDEYAKIEDFDVLGSYQRRGFGTAMLYKMISDALDFGIKNIYLITDKDDTPKEMYKKLGFEVIGEETEIFWNK